MHWVSLGILGIIFLLYLTKDFLNILFNGLVLEILENSKNAGNFLGIKI